MQYTALADGVISRAMCCH